MTVLCPVILCGGAGARLWPLSHDNLPKPFLADDNGRSLLQQAYDRACALPDIGEVITVTNRDYYFRARDEFHKCDDSSSATFILEPFARNTAPAIAMAMMHMRARYGEDAVMLVLPADHIIENQPAFANVVEQAMVLAETDKIVTLGIRPDRPETGYGYIEADGNTVKSFTEKPDADTAQTYMQSGRHLWNAGILCFRVGAMMREMTLHAPDILHHARHAYDNAAHYGDMHCIEVKAHDFTAMPNISVDYAVMEKSDNAAVIPCDIGWHDVGSWGALMRRNHDNTDENGNRVIGDAVLQNASNCYVESHGKITGIVGVDDLIVIHTADAVLVTHADHSQDVKDIAEQIRRLSSSTR